MNQSRLKVKIFGIEYALKADTSHEYIEETANYVDKVMNDVSSRYQEQSDTRIAVLAALNIAEELFQIRKLSPSSLEEKAQKITDILNSALKD